MKTKRLVSLLLAVILVMALLPTAAFAITPDTVIDTVEIAGLRAPVVGEYPTDTGISLTEGVAVYSYWGRWDSEGGYMTDDYADSTSIYASPFREGEIYAIGVEFYAEEGYVFDASTKVVYNGKELPLFGDLYGSPDPLYPNSCATIDTSFYTGFACINMSDIVNDDYSFMFTIKGYELGNSVADITVDIHTDSFELVEGGIAIVLEKDGLPDLVSEPYTGAFEANTPYWLVLGLDRGLMPTSLTAADEGEEDGNPLSGLDEEMMEVFREAGSYLTTNINCLDKFIFPYTDNHLLAFFKLEPLTAPAASGHEHEFHHWGINDYGHWPVCYCNVIIGLTEEHIFGDDNICDVCGYVKPIVVPVTPELPQTGSASRTAAYVVLSAAIALAAIAIYRKQRV